MDALTLLQDHIDMYKLLEHYQFSKISKQGDLIRACCKIHDGNNPTAFVVNTKNNLYYCHTGACGGGDAFTLVQRMEGVDFPSAVRIVADFFRIDISNLQIAERKSAYVEEMKRWMDAMKSRRKKSVAEFSIAEEIKEVTKFRDFKEETLQHFGLGWVEKVNLTKRDGTPYTLRNRLVFPIVQGGVRIGISFRRVKNNDYPKWSHQPVGIDTKEYLYNYDATQGKMEIAVVEGIPDAWAYHEIGVTAVATFGAHLTEQQCKLLLRTGADIILSYDGDEAGVLATEKAKAMLKFKANVGHVSFGVGEDPASISREELAKRYEARRKR